MLGIGETSCRVETLFEGCESFRGFLSLITNDILTAMADVVLFVPLHIQVTDRIFHIRVSVLEIYNEAMRDLLSENAIKTEIADIQNDYKIACTESRFSSLDEFKSVRIVSLSHADRRYRSRPPQLAPRHSLLLHGQPHPDHPRVLRQSSLRRRHLPPERRDSQRRARLRPSPRHGNTPTRTDHPPALSAGDPAIARSHLLLPRGDFPGAISRGRGDDQLELLETDPFSAPRAGDLFAHAGDRGGGPVAIPRGG